MSVPLSCCNADVDCSADNAYMNMCYKDPYAAQISPKGWAMEGLADQVVYVQILARLAPCPDPRALMRKEWWSHGSLLHTYGLNCSWLLTLTPSAWSHMEQSRVGTRYGCTRQQCRNAGYTDLLYVALDRISLSKRQLGNDCNASQNASYSQS